MQKERSAEALRTLLESQAIRIYDDLCEPAAKQGKTCVLINQYIYDRKLTVGNLKKMGIYLFEPNKDERQKIASSGRWCNEHALLLWNVNAATELETCRSELLMELIQELPTC